MINREDIKALRMNLGRFLHDYYVKFGDKKYNRFVERMGDKMSNSYGDAFTSENLRIMEAEYVMLNAKIDENFKHKDSQAAHQG